MRRAAGKIGVMQVIGLDPHRDQTPEQRLQDRRVVIDAAQQDRLRQQWNTCPAQLLHRLSHLHRQLARVVRVNNHINCLFRGERRDQRATHSPCIDHGNPGMKAQDSQMWDLIENANDLPDATRREQKRVTPGDDHLPDLRPLTNVVEGARQGGSVEHRSLFADDLAAKAKAAIDWAKQRRFQEHAIGVTMNDAGDRGPALVADRVGTFFRRFGKLRRCRHKLRRDRVGGINRIDQFRHVLRHSNGELFGHLSDLPQSTRLRQPHRNEIFCAENPGPCHSAYPHSACR